MIFHKTLRLLFSSTTDQNELFLPQTPIIIAPQETTEVLTCYWVERQQVNNLVCVAFDVPPPCPGLSVSTFSVWALCKVSTGVVFFCLRSNVRLLKIRQYNSSYQLTASNSFSFIHPEWRVCKMLG